MPGSSNNLPEGLFDAAISLLSRGNRGARWGAGIAGSIGLGLGGYQGWMQKPLPSWAPTPLVNALAVGAFIALLLGLLGALLGAFIGWVLEALPRQ